MRPLIGVITSERHAGKLASLRRDGETAPHRDGARDDLPARDRGRGRDAGGAAAGLGDRRRAARPARRLCLSGGPDLDPPPTARPSATPELGPTEPSSTPFELALARAADERGLPLLGICRGAQAINVARGGTLHQHLPAPPPDRAGHRRRRTRSRRGRDAARRARWAPSCCASIRSTTRPSSGSGERPARGAPTRADGTIEAVEAPGPRFVLGVQWHAEGLVAQPRHRRAVRGARARPPPARRAARRLARRQTNPRADEGDPGRSPDPSGAPRAILAGMSALLLLLAPPAIPRFTGDAHRPRRRRLRDARRVVQRDGRPAAALIARCDGAHDVAAALRHAASRAARSRCAAAGTRRPASPSPTARS